MLTANGCRCSSRPLQSFSLSLSLSLYIYICAAPTLSLSLSLLSSLQTNLPISIQSPIPNAHTQDIITSIYIRIKNYKLSFFSGGVSIVDIIKGAFDIIVRSTW